MRAQQAAVTTMLSAVLLAVTGCDAVDRARTRFGKTTTDTVLTATGSGLSLGLHVPPTLRPGEEGVLRLSLNNLTDTAVSQVRLELVLPGWAEAMPPRIGDRPVTLSALGDGTTQFAYRMDDAPLEPKRSQTVEQRIRVPATEGLTAGGATRLVRARLLTADGRPLAQVESQIVIDSAGGTGSSTHQPNVRGSVISVAADRGGNEAGPVVMPAAPQHLVVNECQGLTLFPAADTTIDRVNGVIIFSWTEPPSKQRSLTIVGRSATCSAHESVRRLLQPTGGD